MSETVPNAFLVLLGQIGLFLVALVYGLPLALLGDGISASDINIQTWAFIFVILVASIMMVANIMIGWGAVRYARSELSTYSQRLFHVDLLIIFIFFGMNNVIIYALGAGFAAFDPEILVKIVVAGVSPEKSAFTLGMLMLLTASYLFLCKIWNHEFYTHTKQEDAGKYETILSQVIGVQILVAFLSFITSDKVILQFIYVVIWAGTWILVNRGWIKSNFIHAK